MLVNYQDMQVQKPNRGNFGGAVGINRWENQLIEQRLTIHSD